MIIKNLKNSSYEFLLTDAPLIAISIWILINSLLSINGNHAWRQAEAIAQIDALINPNIFNSIFSTYDGSNIFWDTPIYQYIVFLISKISQFDILQSSRIFNCFLLIFTVHYSYLLFSKVYQIPKFLFSFLIVINPQIIHYYSAPLVDLLPIALCSFSIYKLSQKVKLSFLNTFIYFLPYCVAVIIKPPVPFYFGIVFFVFNLLNKELSVKYFLQRLSLLFFGSIPPILIVEKIRTNILSNNTSFGGGEFFHKDITIWFGSISDRFSPQILISFFRRFFLSGGDINTSRIIFIILFCLLLIILFIKKRELRLITILFFTITFIDWMGFTARQIELEYYSLATQFLFLYMIASYFYSLMNINNMLRGFLNSLKNIKPEFILISTIISILLIIPRFDLLSNTSKYTSLSTIEHFLATKEINLNVYGLAHDHPSENFQVNPEASYFPLYGKFNTTIGGLLRNKFISKTFSDLDDFCSQKSDLNKSKSASIVFSGNEISGDCKIFIKNYADVYIENDDYVFWY